MGKNYDNWGRLVEAVVLREQLRSLSLADSRSPSTRSIDSDYSFSSTSQSQNLSYNTTPSPLNLQHKFAQSGKKGGRSKVVARTRNAVWKGLSIFRGFSMKKENEREEREAQWANAQTPIDQMESSTVFSTKQNYDLVFQIEEMHKKEAETKRLRELHTLKVTLKHLQKPKALIFIQSITTTPFEEARVEICCVKF